MSDNTLYNVLLSLEGIIFVGVVITIMMAWHGISLIKLMREQLSKLEGTQLVIKHNTDAMKELKDTFQSYRESAIKLDVSAEKNQEQILKVLEEINRTQRTIAPQA